MGLVNTVGLCLVAFFGARYAMDPYPGDSPWVVVLTTISFILFMSWFFKKMDQHDQKVQAAAAAARARALENARKLAEEREREVAAARDEMEPALVQLLDELCLFDLVGVQFLRDGITTITILAGRNAGHGGGIQPQKLESRYLIKPGVAIDLKQKAIARVPRPARSPARVRA